MHISFYRWISVLCCLTPLTLIAPSARAATASFGIFQEHQDVGTKSGKSLNAK
jgi:hypothetical protein